MISSTCKEEIREVLKSTTPAFTALSKLDQDYLIYLIVEFVKTKKGEIIP